MLRSVLLLLPLVLLNVATASATYIRVTNTGTQAMTALVITFDLPPYPASGAEFDFQIRSERAGHDPVLEHGLDTSRYFPLFNEAHPLMPGDSFDTFRIPLLPEDEFRISNFNIGGFVGSFGADGLLATIRPGDPTSDSFSQLSDCNVVCLGITLEFEKGGRPVSTLGALPLLLLALAATTGAHACRTIWRRRHHGD
jgi:hypothetical protein